MTNTAPDNPQPPKPPLPKKAGPFIVTDEPKKKRNTAKKPSKEPRNVVSDRTARFLLRWIRGERNLPERIALPGQTTKKAPRSKDRDLQEELAETIRLRLIPWLWSFVLHAAVLITLALLVYSQARNEDLEIIWGPDDELAEIMNESKGPEDLNDITVIMHEELMQELFPIVSPPKPIPDAVVETVTLEAPKDAPPGISTDQRNFGSRSTMLAKGGGDGRSDAAVREGLRWLVKQQEPAGYWALAGRYQNPALRERENRIAATAMALLAFQGYGVTPYSMDEGLVEFSRTVHLGWQWLLQEQDSQDGSFFRRGAAPNNDRFYTHGLCTIALCELLTMTGDESLRKPAQAAIDYCVKYQNVLGGWRYNADRYTQDSDVSVTGWIVLALKCGEMAGLTVPPKVYDEVNRFLDEMSRENGSQYIYRAGENVSRIMTAEGLLCRQLLGWQADDQRLLRGVKSLTDPEGLPTFVRAQRRDVYYWYYATNTLFHVGGAPWKTWNEVMRNGLVEQQIKTGPEKGSWDPTKPTPDIWGIQYGRHYTTCFSILILEVYYRYAKVHGANIR